MNTAKLGNTDLTITRIGLGAWAMGGGGWQFGWGPQDDAESIGAIHRALELGINWIDTAAVYGLGHSEEVIGRALAGVPIANRPLVFTKCSLVWNEQRAVSHNLHPESIRKELDASLRRLSLDAIDLYQIHWPTWANDDAPGIEAAWETMADLKQSGKVRQIGVSNFNIAQLERIRPIAPIATLQPPYSMLNRGIESEILPYCARHHIGVIVYSPMQAGLLSGKMTRERVESLPADDWRRMSPEFNEPKLTRNLELAERLRGIGARHGRSAAEVAIAWVLHRPEVTGAIVGARRSSQVDGFVGAAGLRCDDADLAEIEGALR